MAVYVREASLTGQRPVKGGAVHVEERGHVLAALAVVDQFAGVSDLLPGEFGLAPNFTPRPLAAFTPARVRPLMRLRSSSASMPIICHNGAGERGTACLVRFHLRASCAATLNAGRGHQDRERAFSRLY